MKAPTDDASSAAGHPGIGPFLHRQRAVIAAVVVGVTLRAALVLAFPNMPLFGDEAHYFQGSRELAAGEAVSFFPFRPPLYIFFNALVIQIAGDSADAIRLVQAAVEGLSIIGMYLLGCAAGGRRAGAGSAWVYALFPDFIGYSHYLWSESLSLFLLIAALLALQRFHERPDGRRAAALGLAWGVGCLIKPYHLYLTPLLLICPVFFAARQDRPRVTRLAALAMLVVVVVITPWSLYVSTKFERPIIISTTGSLNLRDGTNYYQPPQYDYPWSQKIHPTLVARLGRKGNIGAFIAGNPTLFLSRAGEKMGYLWSPNSYIVRHIYTGKYGNPRAMHPRLRRAAIYTTLASSVVVLLLAVPGFFASRGSFAFAVTLAYVATYTAMITITPALSRYRLPMMVFAVVHAVCFVAQGKGALQQLGRVRVWAPSLILWAALAVAWYARVPELWSAIW